MRSSRFSNLALFLTPVLILGLYIFFYSALHIEIFSHDPHDSYALQASAWEHGRMDLDQDYTYLELAYYEGKIYVSFPPVPTIPDLILVPLLGLATPNNLMTSLYFFAGFAFLWGMSNSLFWAFLATYASGAFPISITGGVWFQAQGLNFLLCSAALALFESIRRDIPRENASSTFRWKAACVFFLVALATGCRPHSIFFLPFFWLGLGGKYHWKELLPASLVIGMMLFYNWARFGNPLEFGHNYLTQHTESVYGQFSLHYFYENMQHMVRLPVWQNGILQFPRFDGFNLFLSSPIYFLICVLLILNFHSFKKRPSPTLLFFGIGIFLASATLLFHKGLGGWHFGNRYFVDLIPFLTWFGSCYGGMRKKLAPPTVAWFLLSVGVLVNWWGTYQFYVP